MQDRLPTYSAALESPVDTDRRPKGRAFLWPNRTAPDRWAVRYAFTHSATFFGQGERVQAVALHRTTEDPSPTRANLLAPLYCNADVPFRARLAALNCSEWPVGALPRNRTATTAANFTATRDIDPRTVAFHSLNPLDGELLLTDAEYAGTPPVPFVVVAARARVRPLVPVRMARGGGARESVWGPRGRDGAFRWGPGRRPRQM